MTVDHTQQSRPGKAAIKVDGANQADLVAILVNYAPPYTSSLEDEFPDVLVRQS